MLKDGADPRVMDEQDHANTPMHYQCRFSNLMNVKSLKRAGALVDKQNDLGITPLLYTCMFDYGNVKPMKKQHMNMIEWLLDNGADINHTDRGGHCALEHAAAKGNFDVCVLLLNRGAKVIRPTQFLSMKLPSPLDVSSDFKKVHRILLLRADMERDEFSNKEKARKKKLEDEQREEAIRKRKEAHRLEKMERLKEAKQRRVEEHMKKQLDELNKVKKKTQQTTEKETDDKDKNSGKWVKRCTMTWQFHQGVLSGDADVENIMGEAQRILDEKKTTLKSKNLKRRWHRMTGKRQIEEPIQPEAFADLMSPNKVALPGHATTTWKERRTRNMSGLGKHELNKKLPMPSEVRRRRQAESEKENNNGNSSLVSNPLASNLASKSTTTKLKALKEAAGPTSTKQRAGSVMSLRSKVSSAR